MKKIENNHISAELKNNSVFLYGAGHTAKICLGALKNAGIEIEALVDDDRMKWGTRVGSYLVLPYEAFVEICSTRESVNVILTSIYGKLIYDKLSVISNVIIWEMYEWYTELLDQQEVVVEKYYEGEKLELYKKNTDVLKQYLADSESIRVFDGIYQYFKARDINYLADICTIEESYFIKEVKAYFNDKSFSLLDAGAYEGELLRAIEKTDLKIKNWYCFELEKNNYECLKKNVEKSRLPEAMTCICENYGLWNEKKEMIIAGKGAGAKAVRATDNTENSETCKLITIDDYFKNIHVDMIKMDIEGAEMEALYGAIHTIQRDWPVLAISIYHYIEDYYRIMQFLLKLTNKYEYYIRQHALIYGETILYAIPKC